MFMDITIKLLVYCEIFHTLKLNNLSYYIYQSFKHFLLSLMFFSLKNSEHLKVIYLITWFIWKTIVNKNLNLFFN